MPKSKSPNPINPTVAESSDDSRRRFDATFKHEAVALGKRIGISQAAKDLDIGESNLRNWTQAVAVHGAQAFAPLSQRNDADAEMRRLRDRATRAMFRVASEAVARERDER